jgi:L-aminopeptidase/D-esterase-like protein
MSGALFDDEFGMLRSPIMLTGTASNGTVFTSVIQWSLQHSPDWPVYMPVVADTWDADLSEYRSFPLKQEHVFAALDAASSGPVAEGNVGGGTGMICHGFKGGIGTASRVLPASQGGYTVGVLVQANYGERNELRIAGVPVGREIADLLPEFPSAAEAHDPDSPEDDGSILVIVGTDAPVNALTLKAIARRAALGLARNGATANPFSGDLVLAFATTNVEWDQKLPHLVRGESMFPYAAEHLYKATIQATEESVINALVAARTMEGLNGSRVHALPHERVREILRKYKRLVE